MQLPQEAYSPIDLLMRLRGKSVYVFPNPGNAGDGFIMFATNQLLQQFNIEFHSLQINDTVSEKIVLFGGGGNLVEGRYTSMAEAIRRNCPQNLCFILPHTIVGYNDIVAMTHDNLEIFCRERVTYENLLASGVGVPEKIHLAHDMTLYLSANELKHPFASPGRKKIACFREDNERLSSTAPHNNLDMSLSWNGDLWANAALCQHSTQSLAAAIGQYEYVATDRLHLGILSAHLGKKVLLGANNYFKNEAVYLHSIADKFPNVTFYKDREALSIAFDGIH